MEARDDGTLERVQAIHAGGPVARQAGLIQRLQAGMPGHSTAVVQRVKARGGSQEVNPEFFSGKALSDRIQQWYGLGNTIFTVGIAKEPIIAEAGGLWEGSEAPAGKTRVYKQPIDKGKPRGWQANFWEKPAAGGKETHNFHVSMRD